MKLSAAGGSIPLTDHSSDPAFLASLGDGHLLVEAAGESPAACIDGRLPADAAPLHPRSAGGTVGLWVAANLASDEELPLFEVIQRLFAAGLSIGGHTGPNPNSAASGCGAADHLSGILGLLGTDAVRELVDLWGFESPQVDTHMLARAEVLAESGFTGPALIASLQAAPGAYVSQLQGGHRESAIVVNARAGTTLDGQALAASATSAPEAFHVDTWSFAPACTALFPGDPARQGRAQAALAAFNAAALLALVRPDFPLVLIDG